MNESITKPGMTIHRVIEHIVNRGFDAIADEFDLAIEKAANISRLPMKANKDESKAARIHE